MTVCARESLVRRDELDAAVRCGGVDDAVPDEHRHVVVAAEPVKRADQRFGFDDARIGRPHGRDGVHVGFFASHESRRRPSRARSRHLKHLARAALRAREFRSS